MEKKYITVGTLNRYLKNKFDTDPNIQRVCLKGEISNFKGHTRGHLYFTLKDEESRINAVMFSFNASKLTFVPEDGMKVLVEGKVSIYPPTGAYQIYIEEMTNDGLGNLYLKYEALKKELEQKGLFASSHKKPIPKYPEKIGIVTAPTGAAIKDILSTIKRRYPICETILFPCLVQGELAKDDIARQINEANNWDLDILIVGRGGGSIEDLWAFNEVVVAEAIYNSRIPIISAVGHEIDFTIADFVADLRAPTPTGAAEMAVPNMSDLNTLLDQYKIRFTNKIRSKLDNSKDKLNIIKNSYVLTNPLAVYELKEQKLTNLIDNMNSIIEKKLEQNASRLNMLKNNYLLNHPEELLKTSKHKLSLIINKLELLNPLSILSKGYSIVKKDNLIIKDAVNLNVDDKINIKLYNGEIDAIVKKVGK
jgi:exodeoxyribonuclease VII large subunit